MKQILRVIAGCLVIVFGVVALIGLYMWSWVVGDDRGVV
jgi:hypothetical protein